MLRGSFAVFLLGEASGAEHATLLVRGLPLVRRVLRVRNVPLIARFAPDGAVIVLYEGGQKLDPPRRVKPKAREGDGP